MKYEVINRVTYLVTGEFEISSGTCHWIFTNRRVDCRIESRFPKWECWHVMTQYEVSNI